MRSKSYTVKNFTDIAKMSKDDLADFEKPIALGIRPIDCVPMRIFICILLDFLQVFIPRLRLVGGES